MMLYFILKIYLNNHVDYATSISAVFVVKESGQNEFPFRLIEISINHFLKNCISMSQVARLAADTYSLHPRVDFVLVSRSKFLFMLDPNFFKEVTKYLSKFAY